MTNTVPTKKRSRILVYGGGFFLAITVLGVIGSRLDPATGGSTASTAPEASTAPATPPRSERPSRGEQGQLVNGQTAIRVAADESAFSAANDAISAKDNIGLRQLFARGRVFMVPANAKVLVLDPGIFSTTIRIMEGERYGQSGIVPAEWVVK